MTSSPIEVHRILEAVICADKKAEDARLEPLVRKDSKAEGRYDLKAAQDVRSAECELRYGSQAEVERVFQQTLRQERKLSKRNSSGSPVSAGAGRRGSKTSSSAERSSKPVRLASTGSSVGGSMSLRGRIDSSHSRESSRGSAKLKS